MTTQQHRGVRGPFPYWYVCALAVAVSLLALIFVLGIAGLYL